jgi:hypothetical protein
VVLTGADVEGMEQEASLLESPTFFRVIVDMYDFFVFTQIG